MSRMSRSAEMLQYECGGGGGGGGRRLPGYGDCRGGERDAAAAAAAQHQQHLYSVSQRLAFASAAAAAAQQQHDSDKSTGSNVSSCSVVSSVPSTCPASSPPALEHDAAAYGYASAGEGAAAPGAEAPAAREVVVLLWSRAAVVVRCARPPTAADLLAAVLAAPDLGLSPHAARLAHRVFAIWMCSESIELELGASSSVEAMARRWPRLARRWGEEGDESDGEGGGEGEGGEGEGEGAAPLVRLQRSATCPRRRDEAASREPPVAELLWAEACHRVLSGKYPVERTAAVSLGGLQARLTLPQPVSAAARRDPAFFRALLPRHARGWSASGWAALLAAAWWWRRWGGGKAAAEARLLDQLQTPPATAASAQPSAHKLRIKYLEYCRSLPFYGAAFFRGQVERPVRGLASLLTPGDVPVLVGINQNGIYVIDDVESTLLLGLRYEELSWEACVSSGARGECGRRGERRGQRSSRRRDRSPPSMPCLFLQFMVVENGLRVSKILQIFSKQTELMDSLIDIFASECRKRMDEEASQENQHYDGGLPPLSRADSPTRRLANKLSRLSLATFDLRGELLGGAAPRTPTQPAWTPIRLIA